MLKKIVAAAALALVASSSFAAAPTAFYGGLDVGSTKIDDFDQDKTSFGGFLGYGFNQFFAVELGYRYLGKFDVFGTDVKAKQTHLSLVGSYPLNAQFDVYGRLGYNNLRAEAKAGGITYGDDTDGGLYGIGLNYNFNPQLSGRFEVQKPSSDSTNYSVGVVWKF
ncbi:outer membrane beta-barrel protein [Herbaspirillum sp. SJZ107]|uniref:outer membrane beta-barrel protein n=1 Tax=Herbaspirillum sp. SJZ107 TaxID=2572881 RepID=UPI0011502CA5|nr:outer membrane beta-barrel protein [Herbaspirillum sp. SJZ107]TQK02796.1 OOP family OmpA-OmpF porin [Herbaspirillum sp. SJZ107]